MYRPFNKTLFFSIHITFLVCGIYFLIAIPKGAFFLFVNEHLDPVSNIFFRYITYLGDGLMFVFLILIFLFHRYALAIVALVTIVVQSLMMLLLKQWIFKGMPRPKAWFPDDIQLNFVEGVDIHSFNTFPSGHTATAFAVFALLAWAYGTRKGVIEIICFIFAISVGFSRIYLGQHFLLDVYFGSIAGVLSVILSIPIVQYFLNRSKSSVWSGSLRDRFTSNR